MPEFILNAPDRRAAQSERSRTDKRVRPTFYDLDEFARGYVEACFFTNGDDDSEANEDSLNDLGVGKLTHAAVRLIRQYCDTFQAMNAAALALALARKGYTPTLAGHDLWYSSKGHGTGYQDRDALAADGLGAELHGRAKRRELYVESSRGWIHAR